MSKKTRAAEPHKLRLRCQMQEGHAIQESECGNADNERRVLPSCVTFAMCYIVHSGPNHVKDEQRANRDRWQETYIVAAAAFAHVAEYTGASIRLQIRSRGGQSPIALGSTRKRGLSL